MKKSRCFLELRVVKTTTTQKKTRLKFVNAHKKKKRNKKQKTTLNKYMLGHS